MKKRAVRFADQKIVTTIDSCDIMGATEKSGIWYSRIELDTFKEDAKSYVKCLKKSGEHSVKKFYISFQACLRTANAISPSSFDRATAYESTPKAIELREITRGLEHRFDGERPKNKYIARIAVLEAQRRIKVRAMQTQKTNLDPAIHLSIIASRFSRWAKEIALETGKMDASDAYPSVPKPTEQETRYQCSGGGYVAHRKKARISLHGPACIRLNDSIIGEQIMRRKNIIAVN